jgi:solute carrier family 35 protein
MHRRKPQSDEHPDKMQTFDTQMVLSHSKHILAASFYAVVSISTMFFNKAVLTVYEFRYTNFILLAQHLLTVVALFALRKAGLVHFPNPELSKCKQLLPVAILYSLNVGVALTALSHLNIPMYGVLKRLSTFFVLIGETVFLKKHSTWELKQAVLLIVAGAVIAGAGDLTFDLFAYIMALLSCFAQAAYLIFVAKSGAETGINSFGLLLYNSLLAIPFMVVIVIGTGELSDVQTYPHWSNTEFQVCFWINLVLGSLLNYSMFLCTVINSALTTTIMGHVKNLFSVFLGLFLLGGIEITFTNTLGLMVNSSGGIWYSVIKYRESQQKHRNAMQHDAMEKGKLLENEPTIPDGEMKDNQSNNSNSTQNIEHFSVNPDKGRVSVT